MKTTRILVSALAAAVLSSGLCSATVMAMAMAVAQAPTSPPASDSAAAGPASFHVAAVVCGSGGCTPVSTKATPRRKLKWLGHG
ncbi:MAG TPA: hypothetical protein VGH13_12585 [Xanthobacteraceae bacterium]